MNHMNHTSNSKTNVGYKEIVASIVVFVLLLALPVARIHALWVAADLYCGILLVMQLAAKGSGAASKAMFAAAALASLALLAVYGYYLIPRKAAISLGTAAVSGGMASKVLFAISGLFALASIGYFFWKFCRAETARR